MSAFYQPKRVKTVTRQWQWPETVRAPVYTSSKIRNNLKMSEISHSVRQDLISKCPPSGDSWNLYKNKTTLIPLTVLLPGVLTGHQHPRKPLNDSFLFYCQAKKQTEHLMEKFSKLLIKLQNTIIFLLICKYVFAQSCTLCFDIVHIEKYHALLPPFRPAATLWLLCIWKPSSAPAPRATARPVTKTTPPTTGTKDVL